MFRFGFTHRLIVGIAAVMLLLCQTVMAASACMPAGAQSNSAPAQESCHQASTGGESGPNNSPSSDGTCAPGCQSQQATSEFSKVQVYAVADLPLLTAHVDLPAAAHCPVMREPPPTHSASPPLTILLCRLLN